MLFLRLHVSSLAVPVGILAMFVSRGSLIQRFFVIVAILLLGRSAILFHFCSRLRNRSVMLLAGRYFLFLSHRMPLSLVVGRFIFVRG